jgi:hypothetical protein
MEKRLADYHSYTADNARTGIMQVHTLRIKRTEYVWEKKPEKAVGRTHVFRSI